MPSNDEAVRLTRTELAAFCHEFLAHPYLCYTEHGQHFRFASRLYHAIPEGERYQTIGGMRMCRVQKEYPTHSNLSRSRRQHWDVSLVARAVELPTVPQPYDHLPLATVVEFGLNSPLEHVEDDIDRLRHFDSNVHQGFAAHLFRLSETQTRFSARDWSPYSTRLHEPKILQTLLAGTNIEIYLGVFDPTGRRRSGLSRITANEIVDLPFTEFVAKD